MIISHKHRFIFVKTRKTAGTSIELYLSQFCGEQDILTPFGRGETNPAARNFHGFFNPLPELLDPALPSNRKRATLRDVLRQRRYYNHLPAAHIQARIGRPIWESYFKFCFVRNPWEVAVSSYVFVDNPEDGEPTYGTFEAFVHSDRLPVNRRIYAIQSKPAVDYIGRYESLYDEMASICERIGLPWLGEMPHAKAGLRSGRPPYTDYYNDETRQIVAQANQPEIEQFGYQFTQNVTYSGN